MSELLNAMPNVFTWLNLFVLLAASMGGLFFGAMPGLSPTMAVALLVPFTFYLPASTSLIMLGAVYTSAVAGGCLSAILLSIPGAPASIATLLDGPAMAKQGRAEEALYTAFISSFVGGLFGVVILIFFAPPLAEFAMKFGPSELFWTAIFGITVITGLSSGGMFKGLFAGGLGVLISTIGYSQISGEPRYVFHPDLASGIALVPALIGFFAVPQIIDLMRDAHVKLVKLEVKSKSGVLSKVFRQHLRMKRTLALGSVIGTAIGIIPGAGGQIAGLMVYDQVKKMDKHPSRFGKGDPEGVCASESANNATVGPALVPLLTLGIPGSPTAAVLLGGLLIHGLFPGPDLFIKHGDITYTFLIGLFLAQFFMLLVGILASRYSHYVANVPNHIMYAAVAILCVFGSYCVSNNFADVVIMFALGMIMVVLGKLSFPSAPLVLGLILGPIAEENFLRGSLIANTDVGLFNYFCTGSLNIGLITLCVLSLAWGIYGEIRYSLKEHEGEC